MELSAATRIAGVENAAADENRASGARDSAVIAPLVAFVLAAVVIFARRPDVLLHAQMWAEDGRIYYQNVYDLGVARTLILPQAGYFQTSSVLIAWIARFFALTAAPFVMALCALVIQALPAGLLMSRRAAILSPDIRVRAAIAAAYLLLPNLPELDATAVNSQWYLALAALLVLLLTPPVARWRRVGDGVILILAGLSGPFALILAPVAWLRRFSRGDDHVRLWEALALSICFALQLLALAVITHHDAANPAVEPRPSPMLGASPRLFAELVGGRVLLGTVIGESSGMTSSVVAQWAVIGLAVIVVLAVARARRFDLLALLALAAFTLGGALLSPSTGSPAWTELAELPPNSQRYFFIAELAWAVALIWVATQARFRLMRVSAGVAVSVVLVVAVTGQWSFPRVVPDGFARGAERFERDPRGTTVMIPTEPVGWGMALLKR